MILEINHLSINLLDKEASFHFYGDLLGLRRLNTVDLGNHCLYYYQLPAGSRLELIEYYFDTDFRTVCETDRGVIRHFAFEVDNLRALRDTLAAEKIRITEGPLRNEKLGCDYMLVRDPNGCELEFTQKF